MSLVTGYEALYRKQRTMSEEVSDDRKTVLESEKTRRVVEAEYRRSTKTQALELQYLTRA